MKDRPFVFIDIPALLVHFLKLLLLSFPVVGDILSRAAIPAKSPLHPASLKRSRQSAVARRKKTIHNPPLPIRIHNCSCLCPSTCRLLTPNSCTTSHTTLAYLFRFVKGHEVRFGPARPSLKRIVLFAARQESAPLEEPPAIKIGGPDRGPCATCLLPPLPSGGEEATLWQFRGEGERAPRFGVH